MNIIIGRTRNKSEMADTFIIDDNDPDILSNGFYIYFTEIPK